MSDAEELPLAFTAMPVGHRRVMRTVVGRVDRLHPVGPSREDRGLSGSLPATEGFVREAIHAFGGSGLAAS